MKSFRTGGNSDIGLRIQRQSKKYPSQAPEGYIRSKMMKNWVNHDNLARINTRRTKFECIHAMRELTRRSQELRKFWGRVRLYRHFLGSEYDLRGM